MSDYFFRQQAPDTIRVCKLVGPWPEDRRNARREVEVYAVVQQPNGGLHCYCPGGQNGCKHPRYVAKWQELGSDPYIAYNPETGWFHTQRPDLGGLGVIPIAASSPELEVLTLEDII